MARKPSEFRKPDRFELASVSIGVQDKIEIGTNRTT
jgi:hypothetical protein